MTHRFAPTLLRDYDLRGTVGQTLDAADAWALGRSFGTVIARAGGRRIAVGYDADFTMVDLKARWAVDEDWLASRCGWSPFTGMALTGRPVGTIVRGERVMWEGELANQATGRPIRFEATEFA